MPMKRATPPKIEIRTIPSSPIAYLRTFLAALFPLVHLVGCKSHDLITALLANCISALRELPYWGKDEERLALTVEELPTLDRLHQVDEMPVTAARAPPIPLQLLEVV
jgi:hypothetical protein